MLAGFTGCRSILAGMTGILLYVVLMPVDMGGNAYIFRVGEFPANVFQILIPAPGAAAFILRKDMFMDDHRKIRNNFFLRPLLLSLVTGYFHGFRFTWHRRGSRGFLTEDTQLLRTVFHGRNTNLFAFPAKV